VSRKKARSCEEKRSESCDAVKKKRREAVKKNEVIREAVKKKGVKL